jgi:TRAP-type C4-dicarboxylate transport system permease small subunit
VEVWRASRLVASWAAAMGMVVMTTVVLRDGHGGSLSFVHELGLCLIATCSMFGHSYGPKTMFKFNLNAKNYAFEILLYYVVLISENIESYA